MKQYYNISIYCNIYQLPQYNTIWFKKALIYILWIAIYCNFCCLNVVNIQSLHRKNDQTSGLYTSVSYYLYGYIGCLFLSLLLKPIFPYEMSLPKSSHISAIWQYIATYSNTTCNMPLTHIVSLLLYNITMSLQRKCTRHDLAWESQLFTMYHCDMSRKEVECCKVATYVH